MRCTGCGEQKPLTEFHKSKNYRRYIGFYGNRCLLCHKVHREKAAARSRAYRQANPEKEAARQRAYHLAHKEERAAYRQSHQEQRAARSRAYRQANPEKEAARQRAYHLAHKEERAARSRAYCQSHKVELAARGRAYRLAHREEVATRQRAYYLAHREEQAARGRAWAQANPEKGAARQRAYRQCHREEAQALRFSKAIPKEFNPLTYREWADILEGYQRRCAYCGEANPRLQIEHVIPLGAGGPHTAGNVVPACGPCNLEKRHRVDVPLMRALRRATENKSLGRRVAQYHDNPQKDGMEKKQPPPVTVYISPSPSGAHISPAIASASVPQLERLTCPPEDARPPLRDSGETRGGVR